MAEKTIGVGIIGAGKAGRSFARTMGAMPGVRVRAICAGHPESAAAVARELGIPRGAADYRELLDDPSIEAVVVASPDPLHCEHAVAAASAGRHVLCEKPMCRSVAEAEAMIRAAGEHRVRLMVGFTERFAHPCLDARRRIAEGEIGRPRMVLARRCHPRTAVRGRGWLNDRQTGGVLHFVGTHNIDLVCWFMGGAPERVYAEMGRLVLEESQEFTDCAVATFRFPGGGVACLYETFGYPAGYPHGVDRSIEILGDRGVIRIDFMAQPLAIYTAEGCQVGDSVSWPVVGGAVQGALRAEVQHFLDCIRHGKRPLAGGEEGRLAIRIADAAREAAETGRAVSLA